MSRKLVAPTIFVQVATQSRFFALLSRNMLWMLRMERSWWSNMPKPRAMAFVVLTHWPERNENEGENRWWKQFLYNINTCSGDWTEKSKEFMIYSSQELDKIFDLEARKRLRRLVHNHLMVNSPFRFFDCTSGHCCCRCHCVGSEIQLGKY